MSMSKRFATVFLATVIGVSVAGAGQADDRPAAGYHGPGPGMMGGWDPGLGVGPGMMGGWGPGYGMGPGMMNRYLGLALSEQQRSQIARIQQETRKKHWDIMSKLRDEHDKLYELYDADKPNTAAISDEYRKIGELRRHMLESSVEAQKRIDAVLTKDQRDKLRSFDCEVAKWGC